MITYVKTSTTCRSKMIGNYFNDLTIKPCGICDNCINEKDIIISNTEFENIADIIFKLSVKKPVLINEVLKKFTAIKRNKVWKVLNYLQSEGKLSINGEGSITAPNGHK